MPKYLVTLSRLKREECILIIQAEDEKQIQEKAESIQHFAEVAGNWHYGLLQDIPGSSGISKIRGNVPPETEQTRADLDLTEPE